jgi:hypothetical protein
VGDISLLTKFESHPKNLIVVFDFFDLFQMLHLKHRNQMATTKPLLLPVGQVSRKLHYSQLFEETRLVLLYSSVILIGIHFPFDNYIFAFGSCLEVFSR